MKEPRKSEIVREELNDLKEVIKTHEKLLEEFPNDVSLSFSLEQLRFREQELLMELEYALAAERKNVLRSLFKDKPSTGMEINHLGEFLTVFQRLVNRMARSLNVQPLRLYLTEVFPGSFGVLLSSAIDNDLFLTNSQVYEEVVSLLKEISEGNIKSIFTDKVKGNKQLRKSIKAFLRCMTEIDSDWELEWKINNKKETVKVSKERFLEAYREINEIEEETTELRELLGILKGISLISKKVEIIPDETERKYKEWLKHRKVIKATFDEEIEDQVKKLLDKPCRVILEVKEKINEVTDEIKENYRVIDIV